MRKFFHLQNSIFFIDSYVLALASKITSDFIIFFFVWASNVLLSIYGGGKKEEKMNRNFRTNPTIFHSILEFATFFWLWRRIFWNLFEKIQCPMSEKSIYLLIRTWEEERYANDADISQFYCPSLRAFVFCARRTCRAFCVNEKRPRLSHYEGVNCFFWTLNSFAQKSIKNIFQVNSNAQENWLVWRRRNFWISNVKFPTFIIIRKDQENRHFSLPLTFGRFLRS